MMQFSFVVFHVEMYPRGNRMMSSCDMIGCLIVWNFCVHARFVIPASYSVAVTQTLEISLSVLPCEVISSACWNVCFYSLKSRQGGCECWVFKGRGGLGPVYMNPGWRVGSPSRVHPFRVKNPVSSKPPLVVLEVSLMNSSHTSCLMLRTVIPCASLTNIVSLAHSKHERSCASASTCLKSGSKLGKYKACVMQNFERQGNADVSLSYLVARSVFLCFCPKIWCQI